MGYNTTFMILNDAAGEILTHGEEFTDKLTACLTHCGGSDFTDRHGFFGVGRHANAVQYVNRIHSSECQLVVVHGNLARPLMYLHGGFNPHRADPSRALLETIKEAAHQLGYDLVKRK